MRGATDNVLNTLSCGCKSEYFGFPAEWDSETREGEPCVSHGSICEHHYYEWNARPAGVKASVAQEAITAGWKPEIWIKDKRTLLVLVRDGHQTFTADITDQI